MNTCDPSSYQQVMVPWLDVPKGPQRFYRPFASRGKGYWMNSNLAGSFAPSSLRDERKGMFYTSEGKLSLPAPDRIAALFLKEGPVPVWALAAYLYRNCSFSSSQKTAGDTELIDLFKREFKITAEQDYGSIFDFSIPVTQHELLKIEGTANEETDSPKLMIADFSYRTLDAGDLGIMQSSTSGSEPSGGNPVRSGISDERLDDPIITDILQTLDDYSGVILSGAPGTSKSYYARKAAEIISEGDPSRMSFVQFHSSYQFEDFMQGYRPDENLGGFKKADGIFLRLCRLAEVNPEGRYAMVIDELSRGDSQRVFGESLTYIEKSKRGMKFFLPSGDEATIPENVYILATMNPVDRGADEVDLAFGRRFGMISMNPSRELLREHLRENGVDDGIVGQIIGWFDACNARCVADDLPGLGHAFFWIVTDPGSLERVWRHQVKPYVEKLFRFDTRDRDDLISRFEDILGSISSGKGNANN